ncbi:hypothetical protein Tco_1204712 [Tanacetum coccineum]
MSTLTFADTYNKVAFLAKPAKSDGFHEIIDFLNANQIRYALTVNHTIYTSCIEQFWATAKAKTVNGECQIQALIYKKKVIIMETSIRSDLHLEDAGVFINQQLGDMSHHKKIYVNPSHTKKIFANMKREGKDFSRRITPLFETMMVQPTQDEGVDSGILANSLQTPITNQSSSSRSQKKQSRRKQRKDIAVLDLEKAKDAQAKEIVDLKKRVQKLEKKKKSRTTGLQRLRKVGISRRVESSEDKDSLGDHEDASKQGRRIKDIDKDDDVSLVDDTQGRSDNEEMFDKNDLHGDEVNVDMPVGEKQEQSTKEREVVTSVEGIVAPTTIEGITLAQTLI